MTNLGYGSTPIKALTPYPHNARQHPAEQIAALTESIKQFGFTQPIVIDENLTVVAGHARLRAAQEAGLTRVPTVTLTHLTDEQLRAYRLADNRIAEMGITDIGALEDELRDLLPVINLDNLGFTEAELSLAGIDDLSVSQGHLDEPWIDGDQMGRLPGKRENPRAYVDFGTKEAFDWFLEWANQEEIDANWVWNNQINQTVNMYMPAKAKDTVRQYEAAKD